MFLCRPTSLAIVKLFLDRYFSSMLQKHFSSEDPISSTGNLFLWLLFLTLQKAPGSKIPFYNVNTSLFVLCCLCEFSFFHLYCLHIWRLLCILASVIFFLCIKQQPFPHSFFIIATFPTSLIFLVTLSQTFSLPVGIVQNWAQYCRPYLFRIEELFNIS